MVMLPDLRLAVLGRVGVILFRSTQPPHWQSSPRQSRCRWWMLRRHTIAVMVTESRSAWDQEYHPYDSQTNTKSRTARRKIKNNPKYKSGSKRRNRTLAQRRICNSPFLQLAVNVSLYDLDLDFGEAWPTDGSAE